MTSGNPSPDGDGDPFGDFLARFFGGPRPGPRQINIGQLLSRPARELVRGAARYAAEHGSRDLDTEHLLRAALAAEPTRGLLTRAGADPDSLATEIDNRAGPVQHPPGEVPPPTSLSLTPAAKRALLDAHDLARSRGAGFIGPEHVLGALASNPDSAAGHILNAARFAPNGLPPEAPETTQAHPERQRPTGTPTLDKYGRDLTDLARQGRIDPVIGRDDEIEQTIEVLSRRGKNNP
ncbi:Clp protease N-terminal domain-containing protein, partial [Streptomyces sp. NPDC002920]